MKLYEIAEKYAAALENMEIDEETGEVLNYEAIEEIQAEYNEKVENIALYIKNIDAMQKAIKEEQDALNKRRKSLEKISGRISEYLLYQMQQMGSDKFETARVKIAIRASERVIVTDENKLPAILMREKMSFEPDKTAIKAAIKSGQTIDGAVIEQQYNLNIK